MNLNCTTWRTASLAAIALLTAPAVGCSERQAAAPRSGEVVERRLTAMGTSLHITVEAPERRAALLASEDAVRAIAAVEERLSTWTEDSELARLNAQPVEQASPLSPELARDLERARHWWQETAGAFDPAVGPLVEAWDLRGAGRVPSADVLDAALAASGFEQFELDADGLTRRHIACALEEGAFGKGIGLDAAAEALRAAGISSATIDLGGQVLRLGEEAGATISIAHPDDRMSPLCDLVLRGGSVATSGNSERAIEIDGERYGHLLDPRTGQPAPDFGSVTVLAECGIDADCLATALFVMGPEEALAFASHHDGIEVVVVESGSEELRVRATPGLESDLTTRMEGLRLEFVEDAAPLDPTPPRK